MIEETRCNYNPKYIILPSIGSRYYRRLGVPGSQSDWCVPNAAPRRGEIAKSSRAAWQTTNVCLYFEQNDEAGVAALIS